MQGYTISGKNGTYVELEDGRFADSVTGDDNVEELLNELTQCVEHPEHCQLTMDELRAYVGAE